MPGSTSSETALSVTPPPTVPLHAPCLEGNAWAYLKECLETGWVSSAGPFVGRFEQGLAAYVEARHAVAVVNGTAGLHVALRVVGVEPGDEVLVPDLTFIAPVNAVRYCQAHPVLIDADAATWQLDVNRLAAFLRQTCEVRDGVCVNRSTGRRVRAVIPVHLLGLACDMGGVMELARRYGLKVVEDAAEAMGVRYQGRHVGTFGDAGVFSFNGNKIITSGGGGMLVTDSARLADSARYLTTQAKDDAIESIHGDVGYNYRLTSLQAAVGLAQLEQLDRFIERKRAIAGAYARALGPIEGLTLMPRPPQTDATYWLYTVLLPSATTLAARQEVIQRLRRKGIEARPLWRPMHELPVHQGCQRVGGEQASALHRRSVSLPSGVGLSLDDVRRCAEEFRESLST